MDERKKLADEVYKIYYQGTVHTYANNKLNGMTRNSCLRIADFILQDRKRTVDPFKALVNKLEEIHKDSRYEAVWTNYYIHGNIYSGPNYSIELENAKKSLGASHGE